ncbi:hypothetical protein B0H13DRAFT_1850661 [Mycena leptocephala]|nr:hypothetical protein B0H13DRAFT_1850661 [Mycena leptocephala]
MRRNFEDLRYPAVSQQLVSKKIECQPVEIVLIGDFRPLACTLWWDAAFGLNENATTFPKGKWRLILGAETVQAVNSGRKPSQRIPLVMSATCLWGPTTRKGQTLPPITPAGLPRRTTEAVQSVLPYISSVSERFLSVNGLQFADISQNIAALFGAHTRRDGETESFLPIKCGHTLLFDELATERKVDYMTETDEMGGFCIEHLAGLETVKVGKDTSTVEAAVAAVKEGKVHISHETSVGAISPGFPRTYVQEGTMGRQPSHIETVIEAWKRSPDGEIKHGPILSVATDGDHKRRLALFLLCMQEEILPGNPLYPFVRNLPGAASIRPSTQ